MYITTYWGCFRNQKCRIIFLLDISVYLYLFLENTHNVKDAHVDWSCFWAIVSCWYGPNRDTRICHVRVWCMATMLLLLNVCITTTSATMGWILLPCTMCVLMSIVAEMVLVILKLVTLHLEQIRDITATKETFFSIQIGCFLSSPNWWFRDSSSITQDPTIRQRLILGGSITSSVGPSSDCSNRGRDQTCNYNRNIRTLYLAVTGHTCI